MVPDLLDLKTDSLKKYVTFSVKKIYCLTIYSIIEMDWILFHSI